MSTARTHPAQAYRQWLESFEQSAAELRLQSNRLSWSRLAVGLAGVVVVAPALFGERLSAGWLALPAIVFVVIAAVHGRVERRRRFAERAVKHYRSGLARLRGDWIGHGRDGERFIDHEHPYASDLDLFGRGSLFELLCAARTADGQEILADWLCGPSDASDVRTRQAAVQELRQREELRLDLAVLGDDVGDSVDTAALVRWAEAPAMLKSRWPRLIAVVLGLANVATFTAWISPGLQRAIGAVIGADTLEPLAWAHLFFLALIVSGLFAALYGPTVRRVLHAADLPQRELALLASMFARVERERFESGAMAGLATALATGRETPSAAIARLTRTVEIEESRHNKIFQALGGLFHVATHLAYAMENWRARHGATVRDWVDALARFEALSSFARHAFENPDDVFPEFSEGFANVEAQGIAHPLIPVARAVRNDVRLGGTRARLWIVSGSNMAGKSTLLRTVGINVALAHAGAPVRARSMTLTPMQLGASMRIVASLQQGRSHLYAEICRFRGIVELCSGTRPVLFLLDEVLHGTNSSDRRAGAAAVIRTLLETGALGMVTTHDLVLARVADDLGPAGANVHFVDHIEDGQLTFDYTLREGPVRRGNALELMRAVGLRV